MAAIRRTAPLSRCAILLVGIQFPGAGPAQGAPTAAVPEVSIRITEPRPLNGRGEWLPPDTEAGFLSTTLVRCAAEVQGAPGTVPIRWRVTVFRGSRSAGVLTGSGPTFQFRPSDASRRTEHGPLAVDIAAIAVLESEDPTTPDAPVSNPIRPSLRSSLAPSGHPKIQNPRSVVRLQQDEIDEIRQEYLDMPGRKVDLAPRRAFIDRAAYDRVGELPVPWDALNWTARRGGGSYGYILCSDALREGLRRWRELLGARELTISSAYRNPFKQAVINGGRRGAPGSMHQYGRAVDVRASLRRDFRDWVQVAWAALDAGADYVETAPEGGWSHVHADWRNDGQGPPLTVKLEIAGRVLGPDGQPVPHARVLGISDSAGGTAGMPAWEGPDADGRFLLRTVWRTGRSYRLRAQTEQGSATAAIMVPDDAAGLVCLETDLVLAPDPIRAALSRRNPVRLSSRGGRPSRSRKRMTPRRSSGARKAQRKSAR